MRSLILSSIFVLALGQHAWATPPLVVEARFPGANPEEVERLIALPLERSFRGLEGVRRVSAVCIDARCVLRLEPDGTVGRPRLRAEVINRLEHARRNLPEGCKKEDVVLLPDMEDRFDVVAVWSDGTYDLAWITKYVATQIEPELARLPGVARVTLIGGAWPRVRLTPDMERLAARNLTVSDVLAALRKDKRSGQKEKIDDVETAVVKADKGLVVRVRDVCGVNVTLDHRESAGLWLRGAKGAKGFPAVLLLVHPSIGKAEGVDRALSSARAEIERHLPEGVSARVRPRAAGATNVVLRLPSAASMERKAEAARAVAEQISKHRDAGDVLWFARSDDTEAVILPGATEGRPDLAGGEALAAAGRADAFLIGLRKGYDPVAPRPGHGKDLMIRLSRGKPAENAPDRELLEVANDLAQNLAKVKGVVEASTELPGRLPQVSVHIDRQQAQKRGVRLDDVRELLLVYCGSGLVTDVGRLGRQLQIVLEADMRFRSDIEGIKRLKIRSQQGEMVPLDAVCKIGAEESETMIYRVDGRRCAVVSCAVHEGARHDVEAAVRRLLKDTLPKGIVAALDVAAP
jgi:multidrug efflux pump subunit AcrB